MSNSSSRGRRLKALEQQVRTDDGEVNPVLIYDPAVGPPENSGALVLLPHNGREPLKGETR
jgi:hypothetical protein